MPLVPALMPLEFVENFTSGIGDKLLGYARSLFVGLATLSLAMGLGKMILSGESNIGSVAAHIAQYSTYISISSWIMSDSGIEAGRSIADQNITPQGLRVTGTSLVFCFITLLHNVDRI